MRDRGLVIGAGLLLLMLARKRPVWGKGWAFPVPDLVADDVRYPALVTQEFKPSVHLGVDVMYRRRDGVYFAPVGTLIRAANTGRVWSVTSGPRGIAVVIDHGKPWSTFYQHLETVSVKKGELVPVGAVIGTMGVSSLDAARVRHLHFATWYEGHGDAASVDPAEAMKSWSRSTWTPKGPSV
jgi:murein DD-endopeptidase MepM/ murein hydrolase activator NlpD